MIELNKNRYQLRHLSKKLFHEKFQCVINNSHNRQMGGRRDKANIRFIVVHYTGNDSKGANAMAHYRYLQNATRYGSAHYYVDDSNIIQCIGDSTVAWSVGDNQGYGTALNGCTNYNSISIEMCVNSDGDFNKTYFNTVELVKELKRLYPKASVCRHYDVSKKSCPGGFTGSNNARWNKFLADINQPRKLILDLSKDSVAKSVEVTIPKQDNKPSPKVTTPIKTVTKVKYDLVTYASEVDSTIAKMIEDDLGIPTMHTSTYEKVKDQYANVIHVGANPPSKYTLHLMGGNRDVVREKVLNFIKKNK